MKWTSWAFLLAAMLDHLLWDGSRIRRTASKWHSIFWLPARWPWAHLFSLPGAPAMRGSVDFGGSWRHARFVD